MLWTGGKDSALALYEARQNNYRVDFLVTFAPPDSGFLAHPLGVMKLQAEALGLPHQILPITAPFEQSYETSLGKLRDEMGIECVITGDIAEVGGNPNWIRERSRRIGMTVHTPLWGRDRESLLRDLVGAGFSVRFSCVKTRWLDESWIGQTLDDGTIAKLRTIRERTGLDLCGEEGEYHTLVVDGPQFAQAIDIRSYSPRAADSFWYMEIHELALIGKNSKKYPAGKNEPNH